MSLVTRSTRLIHTETGLYPLYMSDLPTYAPNALFPPTVDSDLLLEFGLEVVKEITPPQGDVVSEGKPEQKDGEWVQTWIVRSFNEAEELSKFQDKQTIQQSQADQLIFNAWSVGFEHKFPDGKIYHVQCRPDDRGNINSQRIIAKELIAENLTAPDYTLPFRVYENINFELSPEEMLSLANETLKQVQNSYRVSWAYKDAITAATSVDELPGPPTYFTPLATS